MHPYAYKIFLPLSLAIGLGTGCIIGADDNGNGDLAACGSVHISGEASCEVHAGVECEGMCEPVSFEAQCAADLELGCKGECNFEASVECTGSCEVDCMAECEVNPGSFECSGSCQAGCEGNCDAECATAPNSTECYASCEASCNASCDAECNVVPAEADCSAKCEGSCSGKCEAEANLGCQIDCQATGYVDCKAELEGGCKVQCDADGAMFCDGQFVDVGNLGDCVDALAAYLNIEVMFEGSAMCSGNSCEAEGSASFSCSVTDEQKPESLLFGLFAIAALAGAGASMRRRRAA